MKYISNSEKETEEIAYKLAPKLRAGDVICLEGNLGMGKSLFARALIRRLCEDPTLEVPSPTFTLVQTYDAHSAPLYHFDLYRIEEPEEIYELGWEDALSEGITIIEWPERLEGLAPADRLTLRFQTIGQSESERQIMLCPSGTWTKRL